MHIFDLINQLPGITYFKDTQGRYLSASESLVKIAGMKQHQQFCGLTDPELPWIEFADYFQQIDRHVLKTKQQDFRIHKAPIVGGDIVTVITHKKPYITPEGTTGLLGSSSFLENPDRLARIEQRFKSDLSIDPELSITQDYVLIDKYENLNLSKRESECVYYYIRGYTAKQIAQRLTLSYRSIESYLDNVRNKLGTNNKIDMMLRVIETGCFNKVPMSLYQRNLI